MPVAQIQYTHFMFDAHQIVRSNGTLTESFLLPETSPNALGKSHQAVLRAMISHAFGGLASFYATAPTTLIAKEATALKPCLAA